MRKPIVFLGGSIEPDWRTPLIQEFLEIDFINPVKEDYDPVEDIYAEVAGLVKADYAVFYKGGEQTTLEKAMLEEVGVPYKEYEDLDSLNTFLKEIVNKGADVMALDKDTVVKVEGIPFQLKNDTKIVGLAENLDLVKESLTALNESAPIPNLMESVEENSVNANIKYLNASKIIETLKQAGFEKEAAVVEDMYADSQYRPTVKTAEKQRIVATVVLFRKKGGGYEILLERRGLAPEKHRWALPGGHLDEIGEYREDYIEAAIRELLEETGVQLTADELIYVCDLVRDNKRAKNDVCFTTIIPMERSAASAASDADHVAWVDVKKIPDLAFDHNLFVEKSIQKLKLPVKTGRGFLIVFEGIDGAGKSSQVDTLIARLEEKGYLVTYSKWASSEMIKDVLKRGKQGHQLSPILYSILNAADMVARYEQTILPALAQNEIVICDRYIYTSFVRDLIRGIDKDVLDTIYEGVRDPDLLLHCATSVEECFRRLVERGLSYYGSGQDLHLHTDEERNCFDYQKRMDEQYRNLLPDLGGYVLIDTTEDVDSVFESVWDAVKQHLRGGFDIITAALSATAAYEHGAITAPVPKEVRDYILKDLSKKIPENVLVTSKDETVAGIEPDSHITVLYGADDKDEILKALSKFFKKPLRAKMTGEVKYFEHETQTVAYFEVISEDLVALHEALKKEMGVETTYAEYTPHIIICYMQKGSKLDIEAESREWAIMELKIGNKDGSEEHVRVGGEIVNPVELVETLKEGLED